MLRVTELSKEHRDEAYRGLGATLGSRQEAVLRIIAKHPFGITNAEIAKEMGIGVNQVTGRTFELRQFDLVESFGSKIDPVSGRNVTAWKIKGTFLDWLKRKAA